MQVQVTNAAYLAVAGGHVDGSRVTVVGAAVPGAHQYRLLPAWTASLVLNVPDSICLCPDGAVVTVAAPGAGLSRGGGGSWASCGRGISRSWASCGRGISRNWAS